ncbi:MAG: hypothetical protein IGS39_18875 [Calothrix sp. C42_A2020_038]|nr:hypothetical protein [Calothrix sp. C42_A2020_038]
MIKTGLIAIVFSISTILTLTNEANKAFGFTFTKIADTNEIYSSFKFPAINQVGNVVFTADLASGGNGIFAGNGLGLITIADNTGFNSFGQFAGINDNGAVAFKANANTGETGVFIYRDGLVRQVAQGTNYFSISDPVINNNDNVAFNATINGVSGIFTNISSGTSLSPIADTSSVYSNFDRPSINQFGTVAFSASLKNGGGRGIYTVNRNGTTNTVVDTSGDFDFLFNPAINNTGVVAFKAVLDALAGEGIYTASNGVINKIVDNTDRFDFFDNPTINDKGNVAFKGVLKGGGLGIYTGANPDSDKVIAVGDSLFGGIVTDLYISNQSLNNNNQLAFYAKFDNGTTGIFRADPDIQSSSPSTSIPEASSVLGILALSALGMGVRRRQNWY